jgi:hypothetical protein
LLLAPLTPALRWSGDPSGCRLIFFRLVASMVGVVYSRKSVIQLTSRKPDLADFFVCASVCPQDGYCISSEVCFVD